MSRWVGFLLAIAAGLGLGLLYGWVINPIEYVDTSPGTLKFDYKTDFVLMVAETYQADGDLSAAARRLALLQEMPLSDLAYRSLLFAQKVGYSDQDLDLLQELHQALLTYDRPQDAENTSSPQATPPEKVTESP